MREAPVQRCAFHLMLLLGGLAVAACAGPALAVDSAEAKVEQKLRTLVIPDVNLRQATIQEAVDFLVTTSRELDPEKQGINIILNLGPGAANAAARANPPAGETQITFNAHDVSEQNALKIVTQLAGLKYRIKGNVVMVFPADAPDSSLTPRTYPVLPTFPDKMNALRNDAPPGK